MDAVSQVLVERARVAPGLERMLGWSALGHVGIIVLAAIVPAGWLGPDTEQEPAAVMTISLGGPPGPRDGGMTPMGGRPVQQVRPVEAKKTIEPLRPPAARTPEMIEPLKSAPQKASAPTKIEAKDPRGRTPTTGDEVKKGSAVAETGGRGQGFGLTRGGGGTGAYLDVGDFCCPEYLSTMLELIRRNWSQNQQVTATTLMKFTIERDGRLTAIELEKSSGSPALDLMAQRALTLTRQIPPLPAAFTEPSLTVHMQFEYQR
jgi:TonB family protein